MSERIAVTQLFVRAGNDWLEFRKYGDARVQYHGVAPAAFVGDAESWVVQSTQEKR